MLSRVLLSVIWRLYTALTGSHELREKSDKRLYDLQQQIHLCIPLTTRNSVAVLALAWAYLQMLPLGCIGFKNENREPISVKVIIA